MPHRYWLDARAKVEDEGSCRACGKREREAGGLHFAHLIGRRYDASIRSLQDAPCDPIQRDLLDRLEREGFDLYVNPEEGVPLCARCHERYDQRRLDLLSSLTYAEQAAITRHVGIERARHRVTGH
jgi:hypothetical protein